MVPLVVPFRKLVVHLAVPLVVPLVVPFKKLVVHLVVPFRKLVVHLIWWSLSANYASTVTTRRGGECIGAEAAAEGEAAAAAGDRAPAIWCIGIRTEPMVNMLKFKTSAARNLACRAARRMDSYRSLLLSSPSCFAILSWGKVRRCSIGIAPILVA